MRKSFHIKFMIVVLFLQVAFLATYMSLLLVKMPIWIADIFWIGSGLSGIIVGFISAKKMSKKTFLSALITIIGIILILLFLLSLTITSM